MSARVSVASPAPCEGERDAAEAELDQAKIGRERLVAGDQGERVIPDHLRDRRPAMKPIQ